MIGTTGGSANAPIFISEVRRMAGLSPLAGGASSLLTLPPANADNINNATVAPSLAASRTTLATGLPEDSSASGAMKFFSWRSEKNSRVPLTPVVDQGVCGCCWAVAAAGCINDRIAVQTGTNPMFMFQELLACEGSCRICSTCSVQSGFVYSASTGLSPTWSSSAQVGDKLTKNADKLKALGIPTGLSLHKGVDTGTTGGGLLSSRTDAHPSGGARSQSGSDKNACQKLKDALFPAAPAQMRLGGTPSRSPSILALQHAIMHQGPVVTIMRIYADFVIGSSSGKTPFESTEGIYIHRRARTNYDVRPDRNSELGTHCMVIVGWGTSGKGIPYWEVRNSWGVRWGDKGYCKIAMTSGALDNADVGVDMTITSLKNNITTHKYGNMWIAVGPISPSSGSHRSLYASYLGASGASKGSFCNPYALLCCMIGFSLLVLCLTSFS